MVRVHEEPIRIKEELEAGENVSETPGEAAATSGAVQLPDSLVEHEDSITIQPIKIEVVPFKNNLNRTTIFVLLNIFFSCSLKP